MDTVNDGGPAGHTKTVGAVTLRKVTFYFKSFHIQSFLL